MYLLGAPLSYPQSSSVRRDTHSSLANRRQRSRSTMTQYGARHLLIKFSGSRNPVSRRTNCSTADVTAEAATAELQTYVDKINAEGATEEAFKKYATERSDCGSFKNGGDLGIFGPGEMQKQFEDGTAETPIGKMSGVVLSDSGYHLIFRYA